MDMMSIRRMVLHILAGGEPGMGWELIRHYVPSADVNQIKITEDENGVGYTLTQALIIARYRSTGSTNNNEVVFSCLDNSVSQYAGVTNCNSVNDNGDAILQVECGAFGKLVTLDYANNPITKGGLYTGTNSHRLHLVPSETAMTSFVMRLGNSSYTFDHTKTEIYIYGIRA